MRVRVAAVAAAGLILTACGGGGEAQTEADAGPPMSRAEACEAAANEGPLDWWTQDPASAESTIQMFNKVYPDIEVKFTQLLENDIAQRVVAESNAREVTGDLVVGHLAAFQPLVQRKLIDTDVSWPTEIDEHLVSPSNMVRISRRVNGLVYNTNEVNPAELPDTWEELANPKWNGKISVHTTGIPFDVLAVAWGEDKTLDWARSMKEQVNPAVINGTTAAIQAAASGEVPIAASGRDSEMKEQKALGAPVDIKYLTPVPTFDFYEAIPAGAKDVNAAVCFATWYVTDGAPATLALSHATNVDTPPGIPAGAQMIVIKPDDVETMASTARGVSDIWVNGV